MTNRVIYTCLRYSLAPKVVGPNILLATDHLTLYKIGLSSLAEGLLQLTKN
jgi:hypothetical protein